MPVNPETVPYKSLRIGDMRFAYHRAGHGGVLTAHVRVTPTILVRN
jgi:hypothetical protein